MEDYLIDRETLGKFVDELIKRKPLPVNTVEELNALREESIKTLDDRISKAMLSSLTDAQLDELEQMLDRGEDSPEAYESFYKAAGVDLEQVTSVAMQQFGAEFLEGGQNA